MTPSLDSGDTPDVQDSNDKHATCPYRQRPSYARWDRAFTTPEFDPGLSLSPKFTFTRQERVATAGSCFAQNISKRLMRHGYNFLRAEYDAGLSDRENELHFNDMFSARYGNIYTVRHLLQLFRRAYGLWQPEEEAWIQNGQYYDPFRPSMNLKGFATIAQLREARDRHLAAVRNVIESSDILVFTLGLTEAWSNVSDGSVYPVAPGCGYGTFDPAKYAFCNFSVESIVADFSAFLDGALEKNPNLKVILTVSPVPLAATMEDRHVLTSTVYSKSVLRVACDSIVRQRHQVDYFASYEIVNWGRGMSSYLDGRSVTDEGVTHVMRAFFRHYCGDSLSDDNADAYAPSWCDEEALLEFPAKDKSQPATPEIARQAQPQAEEEPADGIRIPSVWKPHPVRDPNPFTVWRGKQNATIRERELDDHGFYNSRNIADYMGDKITRICLVGSSILIDLFKSEKDLISGVMQSEFVSRGRSDVFVYNCGIISSVSSQDLSNLVHTVLNFDPSIVVVLNGVNDFYNAFLSDPRPGYPQSYFLLQAVLRSYELTRHGDKFGAGLNEFNVNVYKLREQVGYLSDPWYDQIFSTFRENLNKMTMMCHGAGVGLMLLNQPNRRSCRIDPSTFMKGLYKGKHQPWDRDIAIRRDIFEKRFVPLVQTNKFFARDLTASLDELDPNPYVDRSHMTEEGYAHVAKLIVDDLFTHFPDQIAATRCN